MDLNLEEQEKAYLLQEARESIRLRFEGSSLQEVPGKRYSPNLESACGAFVTLHKHGHLRGCIGRMSSPLPLYLTIRKLALQAAFEDPRFPPLNEDELNDCELEISILSPMELCPDTDCVEAGKHGVYLSYLDHSAVFLPQVATEQGWDRKTLLDQLCMKAGLYLGAWRERGAQVYIFTAQVISE